MAAPPSDKSQKSEAARPGNGRSIPSLHLPRPSQMAAGGIGFLILSVVGIVLAARWASPPGSVALTSFPTPALLLLVLMAALDSVLGGLRYRLFFNGTGLPHITLWRCMCSNWANMLMGLVTPSQSGGAPAQLYVLWRYGAKFSEGTLVSLVTFASTLLFFLGAGMLAAILLSPDLFTPGLIATLRGCLLLIAGIAALVLLLILFPEKGTTVAGRVLARLLTPFPRTNERVASTLNKVKTDLSASHQGLLQVVRRQPASLPTLLVTTVALFVNKYLMAFVIARALQGVVPFDTFLGLQVVQHLIVYYAPTPGASGIASLSAVWIFGGVLVPAVMTTYIVLWRAFTVLFGALLGVPVLVSLLRGTPRDATGAIRAADAEES